MAKSAQQSSQTDVKILLFWVGFGLILAVSPARSLWEAETISLISLGAGFLATAVLASGYISQTQLGHRLYNWWEQIGVPGRFLAIIAFAAALWGIYLLFELPRVPIESFALGIFLGIIATSIYRLIRQFN